MERSRIRKLKGVSAIEGIRRSHKQKSTSRLSSDDEIIFELGLQRQWSTDQAAAAASPVRNLQAGENEPKKRTPSVIARLMGVEALPSPKKLLSPEKSSDSCQQKNSPSKSSVRTQLSFQIVDGRSRRSSSDQEEFKDVYEDLEASRRCSSRWNAILTSSDQGLDSDALKILDCDEGPQLKFLKPPNGHHVHAMGSHCSPITVLTPLSAENCETKASVSYMKRKDGLLLLEPRNRRRSHLCPDPKQGKIRSSGAHLHLGYQYPPAERGKFSAQESMYREAREIARRITLRMREGWDECSDAMVTAFGGGYAGDESSNESDSGSDSDHPYRKHYPRNCFPPSSFGESSVTREAKKRLSERLRTAHRYQGLERINSGCTLAEMLSKSSFGKGKNNGAAAFDYPLDGLKEKTRISSTRSTRSSFDGKCIYEDGSGRHQNGDAYTCRKKAMKGNQDSKEIHLLHSWQQINADAAKTKLVAPQVTTHKPGSLVKHSSAGHELADRSKEFQEEPVLRGSRPLWCQPDSSESSKEADHPSPVSVLEVPCRKERSSCQSFETVASELHELRKQLHLLKLESVKNATEASSYTLIPAEEETTSSVSESFYGLEPECWQTSYAVDALISSGLIGSDFSISSTNWHYPDNPLDPNLFEALEKKHSNGMTGSKSERKLLFDRLNSLLLEIFQDHVDSFPWVTPKHGGLSLKWEKEAISDAINRLISQDFSNWDVSERELDKEMHWSDVKEEINLIGVEMERLLIDEIISECY